jgi:hypothetical protein
MVTQLISRLNPERVKWHCEGDGRVAPSHQKPLWHNGLNYAERVRGCFSIVRETIKIINVIEPAHPCGLMVRGVCGARGPVFTLSPSQHKRNPCQLGITCAPVTSKFTLSAPSQNTTMREFVNESIGVMKFTCTAAENVKPPMRDFRKNEAPLGN